MVFQYKNSNGYENMVNRRLKKEGKEATFKVQSGWGKHVGDKPTIENKGKYYVQVQFKRAGKVQYLLDGKPIDKKDIIGLDVSKPKPKQGGLDDTIITRRYALDSIIGIRMNKKNISF
jgi:hypothetical protein